MKSLTLLILFLCTLPIYSQNVHHEINVKLLLNDNKIEVQDSITIPRAAFDDKGSINVISNNNLLSSLNSNDFLSMHDKAPKGFVYEFRAMTNDLSKSFYPLKLSYSGVVKDEIKAGAAEYARGFSETSGIVSTEGVYLGGSTYWVVKLGDLPITFKMTVELPKEWNVVSQGERTRNEVVEDSRFVTYECSDPMEEIYLIALPWVEYEQVVNDIKIQVFLREADEELAQRYLGVTKQYLDLYEKMIGKYPFSKFTVVENFWETGYGMPSFTLLGPKVIRFPFILHSSYPHELLHNWWGNSVYVDYESGNWCEGLTAYMADHLIKEQEGQGSSYRRNTLQKYMNHVNHRNDFPVTQFKSRNNAAEEAIGYGKVLMINHMLRRLVGDANYINAYARFYNDNKFKNASYSDIKESFESVSGQKLDWFFDLWVESQGAPSLRIDSVKYMEIDGDHAVSFNLITEVKSENFKFDIPIAYWVEDEEKVIYDIIKVDNHITKITKRFDDRPVKFTVDPNYDIFRRMDKLEVPTTLSTAFGAENALIILPSKSKYLKEYDEMADLLIKSQQAQGKLLLKVFDTGLDSIYEANLVWILGYENKYANEINVQTIYKDQIPTDDLNKMKSISNTGSLVYCAPKGSEKVICFIGAKDKQAIPALTRKLPHYGKYSYLGFEGNEANNVLKGEFPVLNSPLTYEFEYEGRKLESDLILAPTKPLVTK